MIIDPFGIGDVLFTTPVIAALRAKYPRSRISYLCNQRVNPILGNNPCLNKIFDYTRGDFKDVRRVSRMAYIKKIFSAFFGMYVHRFDLIIDLSLVHHYNLLFRLAGNCNIVGLNYKNRGRFLTKKICLSCYQGKHVVDFYLDLLNLLNITPQQEDKKLFLKLTPVTQEWADKFFKENKLQNKIITVIPGGGASWGKDAAKKRWPIDFFARTADELAKDFDAKIIIVGSSDEIDICRELSGAMKMPNINIAGKTSIQQMAGLIKKSNLVLCNDGGPLHIAVALDVPTVSVFGPVDEKVYGPYPAGKKHKVVTADVDCRPCYKNFKIKDCRELKCLNNIKPEPVIAACKELLS